MNATSIAAVLALAQSLLPLIEAGAVATYTAVKTLLAEVSSSTAATPADIEAAQTAATALDAANDNAYAAYEAARQAAGK